MGVCDPFRQNLKRFVIQQIFNEFSQLSSNQWFLGIGKVTPWTDSSGVANDNTPVRSVDSYKDDTDFWRNLIALRKIYPENVSLVVRRYDWNKGEIYDTYRDDLDLFDDLDPAKFYVLVDEERVYKCIDNNNFAVSSVAPTHTDSQIRELSDGYRWKFLYSIPESKRKFLIQTNGSKPGYMPVEFVDHLLENDDRALQYAIQQASVTGSIDFVEIEPNLKPKFTSGPTVLFASDNNQFASTTTAGSSVVLLGGSNIVPQTGFYNGMVLKVDSGMGAGQQRKIVSYVYNSNGTATTTLADPLNFTITGGTSDDGSRFSILPNLSLIGDGEANNNSLNTYINSANFTVKFETESISGGNTGPRYLSSIEPIDAGKNYTYATLEFTGNGIISPPGITADLSKLLKPVIAPYGGHGSNAVLELGAAGLLVVSEFDADENSKITVKNDIRQFGIIKNPLLEHSQAYLTFAQPGIDGSFTVGGTVTQGFTGTDGSTGFDLASSKILSWSSGISGTTGSAILRVTNITGGSYSVGGKIGSFDILEVDTRQYLGTEYQNLLSLKLVPLGTAGTSFSSDGTDFTKGWYAYGAGSTADNLKPSRAIGKIYSWQPNAGTNLSGNLYLEFPNGSFHESEKVLQFNQSLTAISQPIGKIVEIGTFVDNEQDVYDLTTSLTVAYNGLNTFTNTSFVKDSRIIGLSGSSSVAFANVVEWVPASGSTQGTLTLIDVRGNFGLGQYIEYSESTGTTGAQITSLGDISEVRYHSGEVMFIQNIRPVTRSKDQREEIKFLIEI